MKNIIYISILLFLPILSNAQSVLIDNTWIAVESYHLGKSSISPIYGCAIKFDGDNMLISNLTNDAVITGVFEIKDDKLHWKNKLYGEIYHWSDDSLLLDIDKSMRIKFVPLTCNERKDKPFQWAYRDFAIVSNNSVSVNLKLFEIPKNMHFGVGGNNSIRQLYSNDHRYSDYGTWDILNIFGFELFALSIGGNTDYDLYEITKMKEDTLTLKGIASKYGE